MLRFILLLVLTPLAIQVNAQKIVKHIDKYVKQNQIEAHMYFYTSDELRGRNTGTVENKIAARYIAERFRAYGVKPVPEYDDLFQPVELIKYKKPSHARLVVGDSVFNLWDDLLIIDPMNISDTTSYVFINYGTKEDLEGKDFEGKVAIGIYALPPEGERLSKEEMTAFLKEKGAVALMELYRPSKFDWPLLINYLSNDSYELNTGSDSTLVDFPTGWIVDSNGQRLKFFREAEGSQVSIQIGGAGFETLSVPNVVGYIEGSDPQRKEEYIMISAHLDHVGVKNVSPGEDSIYNGARDNGIGITNMLTAAEYFSKNPPKRSLLLLACNAEEVGLLGSEWYANHPWVPLKKTVFNINTDSGGYNDTSLATVVGLDRTNAAEELIKAGKPFGLRTIDDPAPPEENMYERSDHFSFAKKGIPAISYDPGYTAIDDEINKYYHQPADEPSTIDYEYLTRYCKAYIYAVYLLAEKESLQWAEGDLFQAVAEELYR